MSDFISNLFEIAIAVSSVVAMVKLIKSDNAYIAETVRIIDACASLQEGQVIQGEVVNTNTHTTNLYITH
ncbi:hypothetical protein REBECCA_236 [Erwinia phage Rebecca]|uniref:Uncharacterized protein n=1 Tax=Erwinia phage Rebecca TaxID=2530026 RepID=A0A482IH59_9CAUD|nr:hypothetical protein REBECCA_236 [Erwinia phage Rebecca]